jgi:hypothetical protein
LILSYRKSEVPELGARFALRALVHPEYRLHVVDNRRVVAEDSLFLGAMARKGHVGWPVVTVVLAGEARVRAFGRDEWLRPGQVSVVAAKSAIEMRQQGDAFRSLVLEWKPGSPFGAITPTAFATGRLDAPALERLARHAEGLLAPSLDDSDAALRARDVFATLASAGMPVAEDPPGLAFEVPAQDRLVAGALDAALSDLSGRPMVTDLDRALGLSARHVSRVVAAFNARYGFNASTWQDTRSRRRLLLGSGFMTAAGATTELVARQVGYGSPAAFCRALAALGLPSPGQAREAVRALE